MFHCSINGYQKLARSVGTIDLADPRDNTVKNSAINSPAQQGATINGIEPSNEQPFGSIPFGFTSYVSRAKTKADDRLPMIGAPGWSFQSNSRYKF